MADHNLKGEARLEATTSARLTVTRGAESWQFFAFIFAATVTLALALIDELPVTRWRIAAKLVTFFGLAYVLLLNGWVREHLVRLMLRFKEERG